MLAGIGSSIEMLHTKTHTKFPAEAMAELLITVALCSA
jgi:hypothetical protein